jgi:hypothetical protein
MSKALFEQQQEMSIINNYPPDFKMERYYSEVNTQQSRAYRVTPSKPLTDAEREEMAVNFARVDAFDKRNRGQEFEN